MGSCGDDDAPEITPSVDITETDIASAVRNSSNGVSVVGAHLILTTVAEAVLLEIVHTQRDVVSTGRIPPPAAPTIPVMGWVLVSTPSRLSTGGGRAGILDDTAAYLARPCDNQTVESVVSGHDYLDSGHGYHFFRLSLLELAFLRCSSLTDYYDSSSVVCSRCGVHKIISDARYNSRRTFQKLPHLS